MASKKKVIKSVEEEVEILEVVDGESKEEAHPIRDAIRKIFPPRPDSAETSLIRDLVDIIKSALPNVSYAALAKAERYLAEKAK